MWNQSKCKMEVSLKKIWTLNKQSIKCQCYGILTICPETEKFYYT